MKHAGCVMVGLLAYPIPATEIREDRPEAVISLNPECLLPKILGKVGICERGFHGE